MSFCVFEKEKVKKDAKGGRERMDELKSIKDNDLLLELQRRGWHMSERAMVVGCCGKGRKVTLVYNPWEAADNISKLTAEAAKELGEQLAD